MTDLLYPPVAHQILTTLSIYDRMLPKMLSEVVQSHPGCEDGHDVNRTINNMIALGVIKVDGPYLCHVERRAADLSAYFAAVDHYKAEMEKRNETRWGKVKRAVMLWRWGK